MGTLLSQRPEIDADQVVQNLLWKDTRAYRIAITIGDSEQGQIGNRKLFKGYEHIVSGDVSRRRAETLYLHDLRAWMKKLAAKAIMIAEEIETSRV